MEIYLFRSDCDESCCLILDRTITSIVNRDDQLNILETFSYSPFCLLCMQQFHAPTVHEYEFMELKNVYIANVYMGLCGNLISIRV